MFEPILALSHKAFAMALMFQMGFICWYADEIYTAVNNLSFKTKEVSISAHFTRHSK